MAIKVNAKNGGFVTLLKGQIPGRILDNCNFIIEVLKANKLPKSAKWFELLESKKYLFDKEYFVESTDLYGINFLDYDIFKEIEKKINNNQDNLYKDKFYYIDNMPLGSYASEGTGNKTLLDETIESFEAKIDTCCELKKIIEKVISILESKKELIISALPQVYVYSIKTNYQRDSKGSWVPVAQGWNSSTNYHKNPFSYAQTLKNSGYEVLEVNDVMENFAIANSYALFDPKNGLFVGKDKWGASPLSAALLFEDIASAKRSRSANKLSNRTFICKLEVRAKEISLNDANLPEGKFQIATTLAQKTALEELFKKNDIDKIIEENKRLKKLLEANNIDYIQETKSVNKKHSL